MIEAPDGVCIDSVIGAGNQVSKPEKLHCLRQGFCAGFDGKAVFRDLFRSGFAGQLRMAASEKQAAVANRQCAAEKIFPPDVFGTLKRITFQLPFHNTPDSAEAVFQQKCVISDGVILYPSNRKKSRSRLALARFIEAATRLSRQGFRHVFPRGNCGEILLQHGGDSPDFRERELAQQVKIMLFLGIVPI
ncbi:hypothetical protein SDC9_177628 [bioreactor metagenome]|uniref:Uncharacterized protein n=1 Tax=bioreactor metagenome TaxID=1076179 RepID=A0A645GV01_9ZZZZ